MKIPNYTLDNVYHLIQVSFKQHFHYYYFFALRGVVVVGDVVSFGYYMTTIFRPFFTVRILGATIHMTRTRRVYCVMCMLVFAFIAVCFFFILLSHFCFLRSHCCCLFIS